MNDHFRIIRGTLDALSTALQELLKAGWVLNGELFQTGQKIDGEIEVAHAIELRIENIKSIPTKGAVVTMDPGQSVVPLEKAEGPSTDDSDVIYDYSTRTYRRVPKGIIDSMLRGPAFSNKVQ